VRAGFNLGGIPSLLQGVHLKKHGTHLLSQLLCQRHALPAAGLCIEQRTLRDSAAEHFLQTHTLRAKLQAVGIYFLGNTVLVFHRIRSPQALPAAERHAVLIPEKFHHIAASGYAKVQGLDTQSPNRQQIASFFVKSLVVGAFMENIALHRTQVFRPLLFQMDQRPLPSAERKMLDAGKLKIVVFRINYPITVTATSAGIASLQIVT